MTISLEVQRGNVVGVGKRGNSIQQGAGIHGETCRTVRKASKFMCPTHSEAKQIAMSEFGARKVYFMSQAKRMGSSCSKDANSLMVFKEEFLKENFVNVG